MPDFFRRTAILPGTAHVVASDAPAATRRMALIEKARFGSLIQICDGVADDVEIQAAHDALPAGGGEIKLSVGTFVTTAKINISKAGVSLLGSGMYEPASGSGGTIINASAVIDHAIHLSQGGVDFGRLAYFTLIGRAGQYGIYCGADDITIDHIYIKSAQCGIRVGDNTNFRLDTAWVEGNVQAILLTGTKDATIINSIITASGASALRINETISPWSVKIIGNLFTAVSRDAIEITNSSNILIIGNYFVNIGSGAANTYSAIKFSSATCQSILIAHNILQAGGFTKYFAQITFGDYISIVDNHLVGCLTAPTYVAAGQNLNGKIYEQRSDLFMDVLAVSATHVINAQTLAANPTVCAIAAQPDVPRTLSYVITHPTLTAFTLTFIGVNAEGKTVTEVFTEAGGWLGETNHAYATVTSITMSAMTGNTVADSINVGITDVLGLSNKIFATSDVYKIKKNNANALVAVAQVSATYGTYDMAVIGLAVGDDFTVYFRSSLNIIS